MGLIFAHNPACDSATQPVEEAPCTLTATHPVRCIGRKAPPSVTPCLIVIRCIVTSPVPPLTCPGHTANPFLRANIPPGQTSLKRYNSRCFLKLKRFNICRIVLHYACCYSITSRGATSKGCKKEGNCQEEGNRKGCTETRNKVRNAELYR